MKTTKTGKRSEYFNSTDLKDRGWTEGGIRKFLDEPDDFGVNPRRRSGPEIRYWSKTRVAAVEETPEFQEWLAGSRRRQISAMDAVGTKQSNLLRSIPAITIPVMPKETLFATAMAHARDIGLASADWTTPDPEVAAVNYLRHECSCYEEELDRIFGKTGKSSALVTLRSRIYTEIARVYPYLASECQRQATRRGITGV